MARAPLLALAAIVVFAVAAISFQAPASAQERRGFGWSLRDLLFPQRQERYELLGPVERPQRKRKKATPDRPDTPDTPVEPPAPVVEKAPDARVVLVVGDFMASGLAEGLEDVFADNPDIVVVNRTNGSSGFVRDDFYDWPAEIDGILKEEKPAAILVMLGSNDRQPMKIGDGSAALRSDNWTREYKKRTREFGEALAADKAPFLWVGQPAFKIGKMTSDMLAFDDIYRAAAEATGGEFVDIWDGFVDENGAFVSSGPDINGQLVRLRGDDGINLTRAGKRKIAFYAEKPLLKILGLATPDGAPAQPAPAGVPAVLNPDGTAIPVIVDRTPPMLLSDPALDGGLELLGAAPPAQAAASSDKDPIADDMALGGVAGRADDFSWPRRQVPAATAASDTTTAIKP